MKVSQLMLFGIFFIGISSVEAQEKTSFTLDEAIHMAWLKSNEISLANTKVATKKYELQSVKNSQYPDLKVSGTDFEKKSMMLYIRIGVNWKL